MASTVIAVTVSASWRTLNEQRHHPEPDAPQHPTSSLLQAVIPGRTLLVEHRHR